MILEAESTLAIPSLRRCSAVGCFLFDLKLSITYRWDQGEIVMATTESREDIESCGPAGTNTTGGYVIDFWGAGFEIARRMSLLAEILSHGYIVREVRVVDTTGQRVAGFPANAFTRAMGGGFISLPRGDLATCIFGAIAGRVETIFGDTIDRIAQSDANVTVGFASGQVRTFDLVVGADGLHSRTRELVFGPERDYERYLGIKVAAFQVDGYRPRDELAYVMYSKVGHQVARFAMKDDRTMFLFTFADEEASGPNDLAGQKALLHERFGRCGWECPQILEALDGITDLYFDRVSQNCPSPKGEGLAVD
jgi:2-polyprenyl-6-methoxyphenol hydroxylase-like FAD-dependent oxidoreductase